MNRLTETEKKIAELIYNQVDYMYCDNCRFNYEISEEEYGKTHIFWACDDCYRKYNGWGISKAESENIAIKISNVINE